MDFLKTLCCWSFVLVSVAAAGAGEYGRALGPGRDLGVGPTMAAAVDGGRLYAVGGGKLRIFSLDDPADPQKIGELPGLGGVRQIAVAAGVAHVVSRADGYFLIDVADPAKPALLARYDTLELATGIAVGGNVAFVANRNFGVELVDISDPRRPRYLSTIRTGEAQSVAYADGYLYIGDWAPRLVVIADVRDPFNPKVVGRAELDGFGDGVFVRGKLLFAATGHHARGIKRSSSEDPAHGAGHGLEIFDISDPAKPALLSRLKAPRKYALGQDMWSVRVVGDLAYLADTYNGFFVVDVADPKRPGFLARFEMPARPDPNFKDRDEVPAPVTGFAEADGYFYLASATSGLYAVQAEGLARAAPAEEVAPLPLDGRAEDNTPAGFRRYDAGGQVYAATARGDRIYVAAGDAGLHILNAATLEPVALLETKGICFDVALRDDRLYAAEGAGGLSIWELGPDGVPVALGRHEARGLPVKQVVAPPGRHVLIQSGSYFLRVLDVSDPEKPQQVLQDQRLGLLYAYPITPELVGGRYATCFWHVSGIYGYDLSAEPAPKFADLHLPLRMNSDSGVAVWKDKLLIVNSPTGKILHVALDDPTPPERLPKYGVPGLWLRGRPTVDGDLLYVANRATGTLAVIDLTELETPRLVERHSFAGHPGAVTPLPDGSYLVPAGRQGLLIGKRNSE